MQIKTAESDSGKGPEEIDSDEDSWGSWMEEAFDRGVFTTEVADAVRSDSVMALTSGERKGQPKVIEAEISRPAKPDQLEGLAEAFSINPALSGV